MSANVTVANWRKKVISQMERITRTAIREMGSDIIAMTPVRTGLARGNWQTAVFRNITGPIDRISPTGAESIDELFQESEKLKLGALLTFANAVPYISDLELGSSRQAPRFFIRGHTAMWDRYVEAAKSIVT
jgi:hypothetical protein